MPPSAYLFSPLGSRQHTATHPQLTQCWANLCSPRLNPKPGNRLSLHFSSWGPLFSLEFLVFIVCLHNLPFLILLCLHTHPLLLTLQSDVLLVFRRASCSTPRSYLLALFIWIQGEVQQTQFVTCIRTPPHTNTTKGYFCIPKRSENLEVIILIAFTEKLISK